MKISAMSVFVDDQRKALAFYTGVLGFITVADVPLGEHSWLTVASPEDPAGTQISLEPNEHPAVVPFTSALLADGIPWTSFGVADVCGRAYLRNLARSLGPALVMTFAVLAALTLTVRARLQRTTRGVQPSRVGPAASGHGG